MLFFIKMYVLTKQVPHTLERNSIWISVSRLLSARAKRTTFQSRVWSCSGAYLAIVYFFSAAKSNRWDVFTFLHIMELLLWTKISVKLRSKSETKQRAALPSDSDRKQNNSKSRPCVGPQTLFSFALGSGRCRTKSKHVVFAVKRLPLFLLFSIWGEKPVLMNTLLIQSDVFSLLLLPCFLERTCAVPAEWKPI